MNRMDTKMDYRLLLLTFMEGQLNEYMYRAAILRQVINNIKTMPVEQEKKKQTSLYTYDIEFTPIDLSFLD
jgi:hypothetical protein